MENLAFVLHIKRIWSGPVIHFTRFKEASKETFNNFYLKPAVMECLIVREATLLSVHSVQMISVLLFYRQPLCS